MGNFNRDNRDSGRQGGGFNRGFGGGRPSFGGGGGFGGGNRFGGRDSGRDDRPMHKAICDTCGTNFELPFRPKGDRPVYCNDCFGKKSDGGARPNKFGGERNERHGRPSAEFFEKREKEAKHSREVMDQLKMLNVKIDNLVRLLTPSAQAEKSKKSEIKEETPVIKEATKEKKEKTKKKSASKKS
ncbi:hypothetical protein HYW94_02815 [Candidatus Uhrbacteria bacterium]|nr:hypothetical protein [Candidatus Uhrbacteria bacterium]